MNLKFKYLVYTLLFQFYSNQSISQNTSFMKDVNFFDGIVSIKDKSPDHKAQFTVNNQSIKLLSSSFLYKKIDGNFMIQTKIQSDNHEDVLAGLMLRSSLDQTDYWLSCLKVSDHSVVIKWKNKNEPVNTKLIEVDADIFRIERNNKHYIISLAKYGEEFVNQNISLKYLDDVYIGLGQEKNQTNTVFKNTRLFKTKDENFEDYKEYLGSFLEVLNLDNGDRELLDYSEKSWQAPNWTPDGKTLIYNAEGLLYNFELASGKSTILNTGFANQNNNDHVLTFDGKQIGISHHAKENNGESVIYTLPISGGEPKKITEKSPSYLHGWSPDNQSLLYTANRNNQYDIYKIASEGGDEIQLTNTKTLDDGSEYSPDGKYIYFNSARTGTMQIWRMKPDGSNQVQVTFDDLNDWFPHVSPDNKWLLFLSYGKDVDAGDHPFYKNVYLRIVPINGGQPKVVAYLYGGQGTINVPSWNPESNKVAFVSNGNLN